MTTSAALWRLALCLVLGPVLGAAAAVNTGVDSALHVLSLSDHHQQQCLTAAGTDLPFVTISYAQTLDGSIAPLNRTRLDISSKTSFRLLHSLRARHDAVLVGIDTVVADQPRLNVRDPLPGVDIPSSQPRPVVIDSTLKILDVAGLQLERPVVCSCLLDGMDEDDDGHGCAKTEGGAAVRASVELETRWVRARMLLESLGGALVPCKRLAPSSGSSNKGGGRCDLTDCLRRLRAAPLGLGSVLVEGGAGIIQSVLEAGLASQVVITLRPCFFGGYRSMTGQLPSPAGLEAVSAASVGGDVVLHGVLAGRPGLAGAGAGAGEEINAAFVHGRPLVAML